MLFSELPLWNGQVLGPFFPMNTPARSLGCAKGPQSLPLPATSRHCLQDCSFSHKPCSGAVTLGDSPFPAPLMTRSLGVMFHLALYPLHSCSWLQDREHALLSPFKQAHPTCCPQSSRSFYCVSTWLMAVPLPGKSLPLPGQHLIPCTLIHVSRLAYPTLVTKASQVRCAKADTHTASSLPTTGDASKRSLRQGQVCSPHNPAQLGYPG